MSENNMGQAPRKSWPRRHKFLTALGVVAALIVIIVIASSAGSGGGGGGTTASSGGSGAATSAPGTTQAAPGIGQPARDGKFEFRVTSVTHAHSVGDTSLGIGETAQGKFTILHITVKNIGTESQTLDDSSQYVFDKAGRKFSANTGADLDGNGGNGGGVFLNDINPGNSVDGKLYFDLPQGDHAVRAELHDSAFSGGVTVSLTS